jgi:hypothetical protein
VIKQPNGPSDDEQPYAQPFATRGVDPFKGFKDPMQLLWRNANTTVVNVNSHLTTRTAASDENEVVPVV